MAERRRSRSAADDASRAAEVRELVEQLQRDFADRDKLYRAIDSVIWGEYPLRIPDAYKVTTLEVRSPLPIHILSTISAALSVNEPQVNFDPLGRGQKGQDNAELREHFFEASWRRQEHEAGRQLLRLFIWSLVSRGEGILKTIERSKRAWAQYPGYQRKLQARMDDPGDHEYGALARSGDQASKDKAYDDATEGYKQGLPYPIATTDVDPLTWYGWKTPDGLTVAAEIQEVPYLDCLTRFGAGLNGNGQVVAQEAMGLPRPEWSRSMSGTSTIRLEEVWTAQECVYVLCGPGDTSSAAASRNGSRGAGTVVKVVRHGYGTPAGTLRGPYFHALGTTTASRLPERAGLSVLYPFLALFPALDSYLTLYSNAAYLAGFPSFRRTQPPGANLASTLGAVAGTTVAPFGIDGSERDALASQLTRIEPGTIYPWDVQPIELPRTGVDLEKALAQVRQFLELALPSVVQGVISGDESGYALNQASHLARLAWDPIVANAEFALSERTGFESWLIERKIGEKVYVWSSAPSSGAGRGRSGTTAQWQGVGPDDLSGAHRYRVTLDPQTPSNKVLEIRAHVEMVQAGFETRSMAIEALGGDPGEVERGLLEENLKRSPEIQERLKQRVFQRLGLAEAQAAGSVGMPPGGPPGMNGGPPGVPGGPAAVMAAMGGMPGAGGPPPPGGPGGLPNVYAPGQGMPLAPTPAGSVTGAGPPGGLPSTPAGSPVVPNPPGAAGLGA